MDELVEFMENFSLNLGEDIWKEPDKNYSTPTSGKAVISISVEIVRVLITLVDAKEKTGNRLQGHAAHWAEFGELLFRYLEDDPENQLEALDILEQAQALGPLHSLDELIYEKLQ